MSAPAKIHGTLAEFDTPADVMAAALKCRDAGYTRWDVYSPFPIHGMDEAMGVKKSLVGWFTFVGGCTGFTTGMTMIWFMNQFDYPLVVGGKPLFTPLYAFPVSYELTILLSAFGTLFGLAALCRLPKWYNPLLKNERFKRASDDKFFICIEAVDPKHGQAVEVLQRAGAKVIETVED